MQKDVCVLTAAAVKDTDAEMGKSILLALQMPRIKRDPGPAHSQRERSSLLSVPF